MSSPTTLAQIQAIPLQDAYLCPDCHLISNSAIRCPCGNGLGLQCLSTVLNREQPIAILRSPGGSSKDRRRARRVTA
jgi:hypothetical protein